MRSLYRVALPWFLHRPILLELCLCLTVFGIALAYLVMNKEDNDEHFSMKIGAVLTLMLVYLLIPESIRLLPLAYTSASKFADQALMLPRTTKTWEEATRPCGPATNELYVVVGGAGFVGRRIVHALFLRGEKRIRVADIDRTAMEEMKSLYGDNVEFVIADVTNKTAVAEAIKGANCVYAPCAAIRYWEVYQKHWPRSLKINVEGMRNIVEACISASVSRLITTSSSAAIEAWPGYEENGVDEQTPRCTENNYLANYMLSKSLGEEVALSANGRNGLAVGCIRPCSSVWGYGDKLALGLGIKTGIYPCLAPTNEIDFVHVDTVVLAHLMLETKLRNGPSDPAAGQAYCISNGEPLQEATFAKLLEHCAAKHGIKLRSVFMPSRLLWLLSLVMSVFDYAYPGDTCSLVGKDLGMLTFPTLLNASHKFVVKSMDKSRRLFGFEPHMSVAAAAERTMLEYRKKEMIM